LKWQGIGANFASENVYACGQLTQPNTYYILQKSLNTSGTCFTITTDNVTLDGNGYSIIGNGTNYGISTYVSGGHAHTNLTLKNITINNFSMDVYSRGANYTYGGYNGGSLILIDSKINQLDNSGGDGGYPMGSYNGGDGGSITVNNSIISIINSYGGYYGRGDGGKIIITSSNISIINNYGGGGVGSGSNGGAGGNLTITNSNLNMINNYGGNSSNVYGSGGAGGYITITNSSFNIISSFGGSCPGNCNGGEGGSLTIINQTIKLNDANLNLGNGTGSVNYPAGTLTINYTNLFNDTNASYGPYIKLKIIRVDYGIIDWTANEINSISITNISSKIFIGNNSAFVNSTVQPGLNKSANVSLDGIGNRGFNYPTILKDNVPCGSACYNFTPLNLSTVIFNVTGWSNYTIGEDYTKLINCSNLSLPNTVYTLQNDITTIGTCFTITADNITLDGNGHSINGFGLYGVYVNGRKNINIKNFGGITNFDNGIKLGGNDSIITNNTITGSGSDGIYITGDDISYRNIISNNVLSDNGGIAAIYISYGADNTISNNEVYSNHFAGISFININSIINNSIYNNEGKGLQIFFTTGGSLLLNNNISGNVGNIDDISGAAKIFIYNNSFGEIRWVKNNLTTNNNLTWPSGNVRVANNSVYYNPSGGVSTDRLNSSANITLNGVDTSSMSYPIILKDGRRCNDCYAFTSLRSDPAIFNVTSWSNYTIGDAFCGGNGTSANPYMICNCTQLQNMDLNLTANYALNNSVDCSETTGWNSGTGFRPVGNLSDKFSGTFSGRNKTISNLFINRSSENYVGLFGYVNSGVNLDYVGLNNATIYGKGGTGALAGYATGAKVNNSFATGKVYGGSDINGGDTGCLIGNIEAGSVYNSYAICNVNGTDTVGGLVGDIDGPSIIANSYFVGNVTGGGASGLASSAAMINAINSFATGNITGTGSLFADVFMGTLTNMYWNNVSGGPTNCYSSGNTGCIAIQNNEDYFKGDNDPHAQGREPFLSWDFDNVWSEVNRDYPVLKWQGTGANFNATEVYACGQLTQPNTYYILQKSLNTTGNCFNITADNITLDGNGYAINSIQTGIGIVASNRQNITVKNLNIVNFSTAISFTSVSNSRLDQDNITGNNGANSGIYLSGGSSNIITNIRYTNNIGTNNAGLFLSSTSNNQIVNNTFIGNRVSSSLTQGPDSGTMIGLYLSSNNNLTSSNVSGNIVTLTALGNINAGGIVGMRGSSNNLLEYSFISGNNITAYAVNGGGIFGFGSTSNNNVIHFLTIEKNNVSISSSVFGGAAVGFSFGSGNYLSDVNILENLMNNGGTIGLSVNGGSSSNIFVNFNATSDNNGLLINNPNGGPNYILYNNSFGEIRWTNSSFLNSLTTTGNLTFPGNVIITNNSAYFNSNAFAGQKINSSANITLNGVDTSSMSYPIILKDGRRCNDCYNFTSLRADPIKFNVTSWSNYTIGDAFCGGNGTTSNPYMICNWTSLDNIRLNLTADYILVNNLSYSDSDYLGLGNNWTPIGTFSGNFNGNHNIISNLKSNSNGLFGYSSGIISDINLIELNITGSFYTGGLVGISAGKILNSSAQGYVATTNNYAGILAGKNENNITNCFSSGTAYGSHVSGNGFGIGGLVGRQDGTVSNSYSNSYSDGTNDVGSLVGYNGGTIINSYSLGNVSASIDGEGGLVGNNHGTIITSFTTANLLDPGSYAGALSGHNFGSITNSYWNNLSIGLNCYRNGNTGCIAIQNNEDYFKGDNDPHAQGREPFLSWDFDNVWSEVDRDYPVLAWQGIGGNFNATEVYACGLLTQPNTYYVLQKSLNTTTSCFNITADNITLDLNGFKLTGDNNGIDDGIYAEGRNNITILNGVIEWFGKVAVDGSGISFVRTNNSIVRDITTSNNNGGLILKGSSNNRVYNIISASNNYDGLIIAISSFNNSLYNITTTLNGQRGIIISSSSNNNRLYDITSISNNNYGILITFGAYNNSFYNLTSKLNSLDGIVVSGISYNNNFYTASTSNNSKGLSFSGGSNNNSFINFEAYNNTNQEIVATGTGNVLIYNNSAGQIKFKDLSANVEGDLRFGTGRDIQINNNSAYQNSSAIIGLNISANITLLNIGNRGFVKPVLFKDNKPCGSPCYNFTPLNESTVKFNVTSWSNYSIGDAVNVTECGWLLDIPNTIYLLNNNVNTTGTCFNITADNITLDGNGFVVEGDNIGADSGVYAYWKNNITVKNFGNIKLFQTGIYLENGSNNIVINNSISKNTYGIYLYSNSKYNQVLNNTIFNNSATGIGIKGSNNLISGNSVNYSGSHGIGVYSYGDGYENNTISWNRLLSNSESIFLLNTSLNLISNNQFGGTGLAITLSSSSDNIIKDNLMNHSAMVAFATSSGTPTIHSRHNLFENNTVDCDNYAGIGPYFDGNASDNILLNNNIINCGDASIKDFKTSPGYNNYVIYNNSFGDIRWVKNNLTTNNNLTWPNGNVRVANNSVYYNPSGGVSTDRLNSSANIILDVNGWDIVVPKILKDDQPCSSAQCNILNYTANLSGIVEQVIFNVSSWSNYSVGGERAIYNCSVLNQPHTIYHLMNDIFFKNGSANCFIITRENITLDGHGHTIQGVNNNTGIIINNTYDINVKNITVERFIYGIYIQNVSNSTFSDIRTFNIYDGIMLKSGSNNRLININSQSEHLQIIDTSGGINYLSYINSFGEIKWFNLSFLNDLEVKGPALTFPGVIKIENNSASMNTSIFKVSYINSSANITLNLLGLNITNPKIYKDNQLCSAPNCIIINYNTITGIIVFNVTSWSTYKVVGSNAVNPPNGGGGGGGGSSCKSEWTCSSWSTCIADRETRDCVDTKNCKTPTDLPSMTRECSCIENWNCGEWAECEPTGKQIRSCSDIKKCGTYVNVPTTSRTCQYIHEEQPTFVGTPEIIKKIIQKLEPLNNLWLYSLIILLVLIIIGSGGLLVYNKEKIASLMQHHKKRKIIEDSSLMQLEDFIKKALSKGYKEEEIKKSILKGGWNKDVVDQVFKNIKN